jgi:ribosomal protein S18 acetylase RimI-like enzyme
VARYIVPESLRGGQRTASLPRAQRGKTSTGWFASSRQDSEAHGKVAAMIRAALSGETPELVSIAVATGLFTQEDADLLLRQTLEDLHAGRLGERHFAHVWVKNDGHPGGWVYFSENAKSDGVWDLWWIGVAPGEQGRGTGKALLEFVEASVGQAGGRLLLIETSSLPLLERTREFYKLRGYTECGCVPDFYGDGDDKITFVRNVRKSAERSAAT